MAPRDGTYSLVDAERLPPPPKRPSRMPPGTGRATLIGSLAALLTASATVITALAAFRPATERGQEEISEDLRRVVERLPEIEREVREVQRASRAHALDHARVRANIRAELEAQRSMLAQAEDARAREEIAARIRLLEWRLVDAP